MEKRKETQMSNRFSDTHSQRMVNLEAALRAAERMQDYLSRTTSTEGSLYEDAIRFRQSILRAFEREAARSHRKGDKR